MDTFGLVLSSAVSIESISGPEWNLVDCQESSHGWTLNHATGTIRLKGLSFSSRSSNDDVDEHLPYGAALLIQGKDTEVSQCRFFKNSHSSSGTVAVISPARATISSSVFEDNASPSGSGISVLSAHATLHNCTFRRNIGTSFGALYISSLLTTTSSSSSMSEVKISSCTFEKNVAQGAGASMYVNAASLVKLSHSMLRHHGEGLPAVIEITGGSSLEVSHSNFRLNQATGIHLSAGSTLHVVQSTFRDSALAIYSSASVLNVHTSTFTNNSSPTQEEHVPGAIKAEQQGRTFSIQNSVFRHHRAVNAPGVIFINQASTSSNLHGCAFEANTVVSSSASGPGAVEIRHSNIHVSSNVFHENSGIRGGAIFLMGNHDNVGTSLEDGITFSDNLYHSNVATQSTSRNR